jgi:hypothetical protein
MHKAEINADSNLQKKIAQLEKMTRTLFRGNEGVKK